MPELTPVFVPFSPYQLKADARGFDALAQLHRTLRDYESSHIILDCKKLYWFDGHLAAPFKTVIEHSKGQNNQLSLGHLRHDIRTVLQKNGLLKKKATDSFLTTIPVTAFRLDNEVEFARYSREHLARKEMPRMSVALRGKFFEAVDELFANCSLHSQSHVDVIAAGQFYPKTRRLAFSLSDGGRGVDGSLRDSGIGYESPVHAIEWAMNSTNTTRQGDIPGGLGLKLLREFVAENGGKLVMVSGAGWWCQEGQLISKTLLRLRYPGTAVVLEINTSDTNMYDLARSVSNDSIW